MANFYWYGGTGNWSDYTNHWSGNSGNSPADPKVNVPTSSDDVFIDANSGFGAGGTITLDGTYYSAVCHDFTSISGHSYTIAYVSSDFSIYGSAIFESGLTWDTETWIYFTSNSAGETITTNGDILYYVSFGDQSTGIGTGSWTLQDNLVTTNEFYMENGTFDANDHNVTANNFYFKADTNKTPTVIMGSGTWEATNAGGVWYITESNGEVVIINAETSTIKLNDTFGNPEFTGAGKIYNNIWFTGTNAGYLYIKNSNTFNDFKVDTPPHTIRFTQGTTTTVLSFTISGTVGNLITIGNIIGTTQHILSKSSGIVSCDYLDISNSNATGGASWYAGANSLDTSNNDGWIFTAPPATVVKDLIMSGIIPFAR